MMGKRGGERKSFDLERAKRAILTEGKTYKEAGVLVGVSEHTLKRRLDEEGFVRIAKRRYSPRGKNPLDRLTDAEVLEVANRPGMTATKVALELKCSYQNARNRLTKIGYDGLKKARKKCGVLLLSWWHRIARRATDREIPVTVTIEQVAAKFENQRRVCNLTGQPLTMPEAEWEAFTKRVNASLDRIDSTKGYLPDNIQWVLKEIQDMKGVLSQDRFIELCCMVADHHRRKQADIR